MALGKRKSFLLWPTGVEAPGGCTSVREIIAPPPPGDSAPLAPACQLLVVQAADWNATVGTLHCYERGNGASPWRAAGAAASVNLGRSGMAWGRGVAASVRGGDPVKREGDGRSPAGVYSLLTAFGAAHADDPRVKALRFPYVTGTDTLECVEDRGSSYYNTIQDRARIPNPDWVGTGALSRSDDLYRWGLVVNHNTEPCIPGAGSCAFLHGWRGAGMPTAGCTAMAQDALGKLLAWLDATKQPRLVQLPQAEYGRLQQQWRLP